MTLVPECAPSITVITRRCIADELAALSSQGVHWHNGLPEHEVLGRVFDLDSLPSSDSRVPSMSRDVWLHRDHFVDWPDDWLFADERLGLRRGADEIFLMFLCETVHPVVRPDKDQSALFVETYNRHLRADGWELVATSQISGRPVYSARRLGVETVVLGVHHESGDVLSDEYVRELSRKCEDRLAAADYEGAVTAARTVIEAVLRELEMRITGAAVDYGGELPRQYKKVSKLLRLDDERPDLDDRFKDVVRGLVAVIHGLARLRNTMSDSHARERKPVPHHARLVVNAAKTVAAFLVDSFLHQRERGLLQGDAK